MLAAAVIGDHRTFVRTYYSCVGRGSTGSIARRGLIGRRRWRRRSTMTMELESQQVVVVDTTATTTRAASAAHVRTTVALRALALAASFAAAMVVVTNRQDRWGITVTFNMFAVWEAFVAINLACAAYALLTAVFVKRLVSKHWLHHMDQFTVNLQAASTAGAGAIGSVAMWGNEPSGWFAVCRLYGLYCDRGAISLALAFVALGVASSLSRFPRAPTTPARHPDNQ